MSDISQFIFYLGLFQLLGSALLFALVAAVIRSPRQEPSALSAWHVFKKGTKLRALSAAIGERSAWSGFFFAVLFYYALPLWWWQWGLRRSLMLIAVPILVAVILGKFAVAPLLNTAGDPLTGMLVAAAILIPLRVMAGLYVRKHHLSFRRLAHESRGWVLQGTVDAGSADAAKQMFAGTSRTSRAISSAKRFCSKLRSAMTNAA